MVWFFIRLNLSKPHPSTALAFGMLYTLRLRKNSEMRMADNPLTRIAPTHGNNLERALCLAIQNPQQNTASAQSELKLLLLWLTVL
jgi:hypothetical protein